MQSIVLCPYIITITHADCLIWTESVVTQLGNRTYVQDFLGPVHGMALVLINTDRKFQTKIWNVNVGRSIIFTPLLRSHNAQVDCIKNGQCCRTKLRACLYERRDETFAGTEQWPGSRFVFVCIIFIVRCLFESGTFFVPSCLGGIPLWATGIPLQAGRFLLNKRFIPFDRDNITLTLHYLINVTCHQNNMASAKRSAECSDIFNFDATSEKKSQESLFDLMMKWLIT